MYPFTIQCDEKDATFLLSDAASRDDWVKVVSSLCLLQGAAANTLTLDRLKS